MGEKDYLQEMQEFCKCDSREELLDLVHDDGFGLKASVGGSPATSAGMQLVAKLNSDTFYVPIYAGLFLRFDFSLNRVEFEMRGNKEWRIEAPLRSEDYL